MILIAYDGSLICEIKGILHELVKVEIRQKKVYQKTTKTQEEINRSKAHKPSENHPWKRYQNNK